MPASNRVPKGSKTIFKPAHHPGNQRQCFKNYLFNTSFPGDDAFAKLRHRRRRHEAALQKRETALKEKSRASTVAINAEIRRTKARLLEEIPKLQREIGC